MEGSREDPKKGEICNLCILCDIILIYRRTLGGLVGPFIQYSYLR